ncbi:MAG TPA: ATP-binding protein, partial [Mycobacterium sp.]|nr:ATP-binding protein [Mycobacterium sp.]
MITSPTLLDSGSLPFTVEGRLLRELGERLVKQPEVAMVELIKNAYDADARECVITYLPDVAITIKDDGLGMTFDQFRDGWMRIGTSVKGAHPRTPTFRRQMTGEKGIGRFAVRFLGRILRLESVAQDRRIGCRTRLTADFDWTSFDQLEDLGEIAVPYSVERVDEDEAMGTTLAISRVRSQARNLDLRRVRTDSIGLLSPLRSLFQGDSRPAPRSRQGHLSDPGLSLSIQGSADAEERDVAESILDSFVLRAVLLVTGSTLDLRVYRWGHTEPYLSIVDSIASLVGPVRADIRFFPRRKGVFAHASVDGRRAYKWIVDNSGVAVFDRSFRVQPYGSPYDDWLRLDEDAARNRRDPRSSLAIKHFPMSDAVKADERTNWMLRLPQSLQLVGVVQVEGRRDQEVDEDGDRLIASADREGFVANPAFDQLQDLIRGAVESIAQSDRRLQQHEQALQQAALQRMVRVETQAAIEAIRSSTTIRQSEKTRLIAAVQQTQDLIDLQETNARERMRQLEVMGLLGVVAGFMTHEFGTAMADLRSARKGIMAAGKTIPGVRASIAELDRHIENLSEFVRYSQGYIASSKKLPTTPYLARPRFTRMVRTFGGYATECRIDIETIVERELLAPLVPVALYDGIILNLFT